MADGRLTILSGETAGLAKSFATPVCIGSDPSCDFVLPAAGIAPVHATIEPLGDHWVLRSLPGLWIGAHAVHEVELPTHGFLDFGYGTGAIFEQLGGSYRGEPAIVRAAAATALPPRSPAADPGGAAVIELGLLAKPRAGVALALLDEDRVLIAGGAPPMRGPPFADAEVFSLSRCGGALVPLLAERNGATATRLQDGTILIAGGGTNTAELFDPRSLTSRPTADGMKATRAHATAVALPNGLVMILGGLFSPGPMVAEVYDPARRRFGGLRSPELGYASVAALGDGVFLVAATSGGMQRGPSKYYVFDSRSWRFDEVAAPPAPRWNVQLASLGGGRAVVLCGSPQREHGRTVECFTLATREWVRLTDMRTLRGSPAVVSTSSRVFAIGGDSLGTGLYSGEYLDAWSWRALPPIWHGISPSGGLARADGSAAIVGIRSVSLVAT